MGVGKAAVDHQSDGDRHHQRRGRGDDQRDEGGEDPTAMDQRVGQQRPQGVQRNAGGLGRRAGGQGHRVRGLLIAVERALPHDRGAKIKAAGLRAGACAAPGRAL